jgi:serine/threonine-protein kinase
VRLCPFCQRQFPDDFGDRCPDDGSVLYVASEDSAKAKAAEMAPGVVVAGKYEILEEMPRRGGAGRTFKARQENLDRIVELRVLPTDTLTHPSDHARFNREVQTWARLRSDHIVRLYDSGFTERNAPYMALEYVEGVSIADRIRSGELLPFRTCMAVAQQLLEGLVAAHEANVLHRDISPDAVVLTESSEGRIHARLTGFGLAKHMGDGDDDPTAITMTGHVVGNPAYMAPETIMQGTLEPRTDLYALGVTLYELVGGRRPYPGTSLAELLGAHVKGTPDPLTMHRADTPESIRLFIETLIAKSPDLRFHSARAALDALPTGAGRPSDAASLPPGALQHGSLPPGSLPVGAAQPAAAPTGGSGAKRGLLWIGIGLALGLGAVLGLVLMRMGQS